jgi:hypothetical protein
MACFQTKNPNLGKSWKDMQWQMLVYLWSFGPFYDHLVYFVAIWYNLWTFGIFFPFWYVVPRKIWQPCSELHPFFIASDLDVTGFQGYDGNDQSLECKQNTPTPSPSKKWALCTIHKSPSRTESVLHYDARN